ncbi:hypothetical protein [Gemmatimonas aurantiaca]|uniref:hypothetical protein n=1 Tax=Gemmatimonas aurantiaca TaxID=173480 RepID=UPI00301DC1F6
MSTLHEMVGMLGPLGKYYRHHQAWNLLGAFLAEPVYEKMKPFLRHARNKAGVHADARLITDSLAIFSADARFNYEKEPDIVLEDNSTGHLMDHHFHAVDIFAITFALQKPLPNAEEIGDFCRRHGMPFPALTSGITESDLPDKLERSMVATTTLAVVLIRAIRELVHAVHVEMGATVVAGDRRAAKGKKRNTTPPV